jgi:hypothetical protein
MERVMHQLSILIASTSIGLFFLSTSSIGVNQSNIAQSLSQKASLTKVWIK